MKALSPDYLDESMQRPWTRVHPYFQVHERVSRLGLSGPESTALHALRNRGEGLLREGAGGVVLVTIAGVCECSLESCPLFN